MGERRFLPGIVDPENGPSGLPPKRFMRGFALWDEMCVYANDVTYIAASARDTAELKATEPGDVVLELIDAETMDAIYRLVRATVDELATAAEFWSSKPGSPGVTDRYAAAQIERNEAFAALPEILRRAAMEGVQ